MNDASFPVQSEPSQSPSDAPDRGSAPVQVTTLLLDQPCQRLRRIHLILRIVVVHVSQVKTFIPCIDCATMQQRADST